MDANRQARMLVRLRDSVFECLHAIGYHGYVTVHQAFGGIMSVTDAVTKSHEFLKAYSGDGPA